MEGGVIGDADRVRGWGEMDRKDCMDREVCNKDRKVWGKDKKVYSTEYTDYYHYHRLYLEHRNTYQRPYNRYILVQKTFISGTIMYSPWLDI